MTCGFSAETATAVLPPFGGASGACPPSPSVGASGGRLPAPPPPVQIPAESATGSQIPAETATAALCLTPGVGALPRHSRPTRNPVCPPYIVKDHQCRE